MCTSRLLFSSFCTLFMLSLPLPSNAQSLDIKSATIKWSGEGLQLELQAMPLDLVRAFFLGRGFTASDADFIARTGCIYRSAMGNSGVKPNDPPTVIKLAKWRIVGPKGRSTIKTRQDWAKIWETKKVSDSARVAFHWALFPTSQSYRANDYNWGMISFGMPAGARFDLEVHWLSGDVEKTRVLKNMECGK